MNCHGHEGVRASARCTRCGVLLCAICRAERAGRALCPNCVRGGGEVVKAIRVFAPAPPIPPAMPVSLEMRRRGPSPISPIPSPPTPVPPAAAHVARRAPRPAVAGALGVVPGFGHFYAGKPLRGFALFLAAPFALIATAAGALPLVAYAFLHGY